MNPEPNKYYVKMVIYDNVNTNPDAPEVWLDEPFYGPDEIEIQARNLARQLRRKLEAEQ